MKKYITIGILFVTNGLMSANAQTNGISTSGNFDESKILLGTVMLLIIGLIAFIIKSNIDYKGKNKHINNASNQKKKKRRKN